MIKRIVTPVCLAMFAMTASLSSASTANASQYGSFVLHNPSNVTINYSVVWGDGEVEWFSVAPHAQNAHYVVLDSNGRIPIPYISFDCRGGDGVTTLLSYELDAYATNSPHNGKDYTFVYSADGRFLDLLEG